MQRRVRHDRLLPITLLMLLPAIIVSCLAVAAAPVLADDAPLPTLRDKNQPGGVQFLRPQRWGMVKSVLSNPADTDAQVIVSVNAGEFPSLQFASQLWLPAGSRRVVHTPIFAQTDKRISTSLQVQSRLIMNVNGTQRVQGPFDGMMSRRDGPFNCAVLADADNDPANRLLAALRHAAGLDAATSFMAADDAPWSSQGYDALDGLIVSGNTQLNEMQCDAIRRWVRAGGHLWLMLDAVDDSFAHRLFADEWTVSVIDRVQLNHFTIVDSAGQSIHQQFDDAGVKLLRVIAPGFTVTHQIDGSPAALRKKIGDGQLMVTLLSPPGWQSSDATSSSLRGLTWFLEAGQKQPDFVPAAPNAFSPIVNQRIGYQVLSRGWIVAILSLFALFILLIALKLDRMHRLEWVGPVGLLGAVIATVLLIVVGLSRQSKTPATVFTAQLVQYAPSSNRAAVSESISIYLPPGLASPADVIMADQGILMPAPDRRGSVSRIDFTDPVNLAIRDPNARQGAVTAYLAQSQITCDQAPRMIVHFDQQGLVGDLQHIGDDSLDGAMLVGPNGALSLNKNADNRFTAGPEQVLLPGQFSHQAILDAAAAARQATLRELAAVPSFAPQLSLIGWSSPVQTAVTVPGPFTPQGIALKVIPLQFQPVEPGSPITIPSPLMLMKPFRGTVNGRSIVSSPYNPATHAWLANIQQPMIALMRFELPPGYAMNPQSAKFQIDVRAPGRTYRIITLDDRSQLRTIDSGSNPLGRLQFNLADDKLPATLDDGSLVIGIDVGPSADPTRPQPWAITGMTLSIAGTAR